MSSKQTAEARLAMTGVFGPVPGLFAQGYNTANPVPWTSEAWNRQAFNYFFQQLLEIALARFRWVDLPPKVDERFLEYTLLWNGVATISWPRDLPPQNAFAMQAVLSAPNGNLEQTHWRAQGANGGSWDADTTNGVIVWGSQTRLPLIPQLQFVASECANIVRTKQTVRQHMRQPVLITAPREMSQQLHNLMAATANGEPYVLGYDRFATDIQTEVLPVASGAEAQQLPALQSDLKDVWNLGLATLGINVAERKQERQSVAEIRQADEPSTMLSLSPLLARRAACAQLNELTGGTTDVYWNQDIESDTFNALNNIDTQLQSMQGGALLRPETGAENEAGFNGSNI